MAQEHEGVRHDEEPSHSAVDLPQRLDVVVLRLHAGECPGRLDDDVRQLRDAERACRLVLRADLGGVLVAGQQRFAGLQVEADECCPRRQHQGVGDVSALEEVRPPQLVGEVALHAGPGLPGPGEHAPGVERGGRNDLGEVEVDAGDLRGRRDLVLLSGRRLGGVAQARTERQVDRLADEDGERRRGPLEPRGADVRPRVRDVGENERLHGLRCLNASRLRVDSPRDSRHSHSLRMEDANPSSRMVLNESSE